MTLGLDCHAPGVGAQGIWLVSEGLVANLKGFLGVL